MDKNNTMITIEQATTDEHLTAIADLAKLIWHEHFTPIIGTDQVTYMLDKFQSFPALKEQVSQGYEYYRILDNGKLCGYTGIHPDESNRLFLSKLYIHKDYRGKHISSLVFHFLKDLCQTRGYSAIWLTCNKHNTHTLEVYRHLGFRQIDTQEADIGNGFIMDDYIMEYEL